MIDGVPPVRIERWAALGDSLGIELYVAREDLLPFPLAGNKVRKLVAELASIDDRGTALVTNGAVDSNHCRTAAWLAAERGLRAHFILHDQERQGRNAAGLRVLEALGASYVVVPAAEVAAEITTARTSLESEGYSVHVIAGGCHTPRGAIAYRDAALAAFGELSVDTVFVPSGTGATQGGIAAAASQSELDIEVVGVSVARSADRGAGTVAEAAAWAGSPNADITFLDGFRAGGYGRTSAEIRAVVNLGWRHGLPLDETYTGKAMWAVETIAREGRLVDKRVLFWHTGGLWNQLVKGLGRA